VSPTTTNRFSYQVSQYPTAMSAWGMMAPAAPAEPEPAPVADAEVDDDFPAIGAVVMKTKTGNVEDEYRCVLMWSSVSSMHVPGGSPGRTTATGMRRGCSRGASVEPRGAPCTAVRVPPISARTRAFALCGRTAQIHPRSASGLEARGVCGRVGTIIVCVFGIGVRCCASAARRRHTPPRSARDAIRWRPWLKSPPLCVRRCAMGRPRMVHRHGHCDTAVTCCGDRGSETAALHCGWEMRRRPAAGCEEAWLEGWRCVAMRASGSGMLHGGRAAVQLRAGRLAVRTRCSVSWRDSLALEVGSRSVGTVAWRVARVRDAMGATA
jgi:hypothetical protein